MILTYSVSVFGPKAWLSSSCPENQNRQAAGTTRPHQRSPSAPNALGRRNHRSVAVGKKGLVPTKPDG